MFMCTGFSVRSLPCLCAVRGKRVQGWLGFAFHSRRTGGGPAAAQQLVRAVLSSYRQSETPFSAVPEARLVSLRYVPSAGYLPSLRKPVGTHTFL